MDESSEADQRRYAPLGRYLRELPASQAGVALSFDEIETIIGATLPRSASEYRQWWANQSYGSRAYHWDGAGFKVDKVSFRQRVVHFLRKDTPVRVPRPLTLQEVITEVNEDAQARPIGGVQRWRMERHGFRRLPNKTLFYSTIDQDRDWAFHVGGYFSSTSRLRARR